MLKIIIIKQNLESKKLIKDLIKKIIVFTSKYEQKQIMEVANCIWI